MKHFVILIAIVLTICSCDNQSQQREREAEKQRQDSIQAILNELNESKQKLEQLEAERKAEAEKKTFKTSLGTVDEEICLKECYQQGASWGAFDKQYHRSGSEYPTEEFFKSWFVQTYGVPSNDKALNAYKKCYIRYCEGYNAAYNF